ncbi:MAG: 50S ribosomal protein L18e [Candidatus Verstraetearchaeota archaeon]|nr:50S ribosomal protein L18e [Candidatus Verstraetearchaeota archaeon]
MVKRTLPTSPRTRHIIKLLRRASRSNNADVWRSLSDSLSAPSRRSVAINLSKIDKLTKKGDFVAVSGKVLGFGNVSKKVDVAALSFSQTAKAKIAQSGGRAVSLEVLLKLNPRGRGVKILR